MNGEISFRHNVINIQSLDTFIHIRGGFYHGRKDVYFVRAIGECPDFLKVFETLDGKLTEAEKSNQVFTDKKSAEFRRKAGIGILCFGICQMETGRADHNEKTS